MAKITYENKVALNVNSDIADVNKCNATDLNEIKQVVNENDDNTTNNSNAIGNLSNLNTTNKNNLVSAINSIIESGSNENGTYIKFADGTMIITQNFTKNIKVNTKESGTYLYYGILHEEDIPMYPQIFASILSANINIFDNSCMCGTGTQDGPGLSKISKRIYVYSTASVTKNVKFYVFVIGRWK